MKVVIGVDSGGSTTRALAVSLEGQRVGYAETGGGNPFHDADARANIRMAISEAAGECGIENVGRVVAGIAGFNNLERDQWVNEATDAPGLTGVRVHVNDAEVAHFGAFAGRPGIVSVQGTGSIVIAILEDGRILRNGDFSHYARSAAVWVGTKAVQQLLIEFQGDGEEALHETAFAQWQVTSIEELRTAVALQSKLEAKERSRRYGAIAKTVTALAIEGMPCSSAICDGAAAEIVEGVRLLGHNFASEEVGVALVGACGRSQPIRQRVTDRLEAAGEKRYRVFESAAPPVVGAVQMALAAEGCELDLAARDRLCRT